MKIRDIAMQQELDIYLRHKLGIEASMIYYPDEITPMPLNIYYGESVLPFGEKKRAFMVYMERDLFRAREERIAYILRSWSS